MSTRILFSLLVKQPKTPITSKSGIKFIQKPQTQMNDNGYDFPPTLKIIQDFQNKNYQQNKSENGYDFPPTLRIIQKDLE